jgi:cell division protein FtsI (penicillin-binding protein 3)
VKTNFKLRKNSTPIPSLTRLRILVGFIFLAFVLVEIRLFYWQVFKANNLQAEANRQYQKLIINTGKRGSIYTSDDHLLVGNQKVYRLFTEPPLISESADKIHNQIFNLLLETNDEFKEATQEANKKEIKEEFSEFVKGKLEINDKKWVGILSGIDEKTKENLEKLEIAGLGFDPYYERFYPEASMAAHITGFVGQDKDGLPLGYFGVEGALNKELSAKTNKEITSTFAFKKEKDKKTNGRDITLTIRRDVQFMVETELKKALKLYGAKAGEIIVMEPKTGKIIALASFPNYNQKDFYKFSPELYRNPSVSSFYEPGSTFKVITMAAGIDTKSITPEMECDNCASPRRIDKYTIRTWNDVYNPNINMTDALAKSDNIAMIFAEEKIGKENFIKYVKDFGFGQKTTNDLQEDSSPSFPEKWGIVELATRSFGQGISASSLQIIRAVNTISNKGLMVQPQIVEKVSNVQTGEEIFTSTIELAQIVSPETAETVVGMMVESANKGEAQWIASDSYLVAGKTGTSQIPNSDGGYEEDKTVASFIGFAPADNPQFIMLTKLVEPTLSPWASETATPLWYKIADKLILMLEVTL